MLLAIDERGYAALRTRALCRRAGVSTRDLYRHYKGGIHDCFLDCLDQIARTMCVRATRAWKPGACLEERVSLLIWMLTDLAANEPEAARLALCEPFAVGPAALEAMLAVEQELYEMFDADLASGAVRRPPPIALRAVLAGVLDVTRARLLEGRPRKMLDAAPALCAWAARCIGTLYVFPDTGGLPHAALRYRPSAVALDVPPWEVSARRRIMAASAHLVARVGYFAIPESTIRTAAGVTRREFLAHFADKRAAFMAACQALWMAALDHARRVGGRADKSQGLRCAVSALVGCLAADPVFARLSLIELPAVSNAHDRRRMMELGAGALLSANMPAARQTDSAIIEAAAAGAWSAISRYGQSTEREERRRIVQTVCVLTRAVGNV
jgi:AcrR family transcriptional regulator